MNKGLLYIIGAAVVLAAAYYFYTGQENGLDMQQAAMSDVSESVPEYSAEQFFNTISYSIPGNAMSDDGTWFAFTSDEAGTPNVYRMNLETGAQEQLTDSEGPAHTAISVFPNDDRILYTADGGGDELFHIYVIEEGGSHKDLTPGENLRALFMGWVDDGSAFYLATNERDSAASDIYRYDAETYDREMVFQNDNAVSISDISPNGQYLVYIDFVSNTDRDIYLVDLESDSGPVQIAGQNEDADYSNPIFSFDSQSVFLTTDSGRDMEAAIRYDIESGETEMFAEREWPVLRVVDSPNGTYRMVFVNEEARTKVEVYDRESGELLNWSSLPEFDSITFAFNADETEAVISLGTDTSPTNLYYFDIESGALRQLTDALNGAVDPDHLVAAEHIYYPSTDGVMIPALLYKPYGASADNPVPSIVFIHGGPGGQSRHGYYAAVQHLVNQGYAVLRINNRGSSGYGKTFFHMDDRAHGEEDMKDVIAAEDYMDSFDWTTEQTAVMGGSYGGYLTVAVAAFHPEVYDVAIDIFGVTNWVRTLQSIPPWWASFRESLYAEMGDPAEDAERHERISPLFHPEGISKPLLVVQGENDPRVLKVESDEIVEAVRANGVPVEYVVFPDEGHGFRQKANQITAQKAYVDFLEQYLLGNGE